MKKFIEEMMAQFRIENNINNTYYFTTDNLNKWNEYIAEKLANEMPTKNDLLRIFVRCKYEGPALEGGRTVMLTDEDLASEMILKMLK